MRGAVGRRQIGKYLYDKQLSSPPKMVPCEVQVYALRVREQDETWPEASERQTRWCQPDEAVKLVGEKELGSLIANFVARQASR